MRALVIGGTGRVGTAVARLLLERGVTARVLTRNQTVGSSVPAGAEVAIGNLLDPDSVRTALKAVDKVFLLNAVAGDDLTQALLAFNLVREHGVEHLTYLSIYKVDQFPDVPHFGAKIPVEAALRASKVPFTILRAASFFQNDLGLKAALIDSGIYPTPIGTAGIGMVDTRDVAEAAAITLTTGGYEGTTHNLVSAVPVSGPRAAALWTEALGKPIRYTGDAIDQWEAQLATKMPAWAALQMRIIYQTYQERGFSPETADVEAMKKLLGRAPRTYDEFVRETAAEWRT